jgi:c-di-GMP-binding flagellar brake protein YcgR
MDGQAQTLDDLAVLAEACNRNLPLELHYVNSEVTPTSVEPDILIARTRLIRMEGDTIHVDNAQDIGKEVRLRQGETVDAFFTFNDVLRTFRTTIRALRQAIDLNREMRVIGAILDCPKVISSGQRREDFRASVVALEPIDVHLHETDAEAPNNCPLNARRWTGRMFDISRGGAGVRLEGPTRYTLRAGRVCYLSFALPGLEGGFLFLGEARYVRELPGKDACLVGFQFLRWPDAPTLRGQQNSIGRFTTAVERNRRARSVR